MNARSRFATHEEVQIVIWQILEDKCHVISVFQDSGSSRRRKPQTSEN